MKKTLIMLLILAAIQPLWSQSITPKVVSSAGGTAVSGSYMLTYNIGEPAVTTLTAGGSMLTQGFEQPGEQIITGTISPLAFCPGAAVTVPFTSVDIVDGNTFTAQLSDASGSFASPANIGTLSGYQSGSIAATIPANTPAGNGYRIRVVSSTPATDGDDNGTNLTVYPAASAPVISPSTGQITCIATTVTFEAFSGNTFNWGGGNTDAQYVVSSAGTYTLTITDANGCSATGSVVASLNTAAPNVAIVVNGPSAICPPQTVTLTASGGDSYVWSDAGSGTLSTVTAAAPGNYCVQATDNSNGCTAQVCSVIASSCGLQFDCATNPNVIPTAPSLSLGSNPYSQVVASWPTSNAPTGYRVEWRVQGATTSYSYANTSNINYVIASLQPGTTYEVRVLSRCSNIGRIVYSPWSSITTQAMPGCGSAVISCGASTTNSIAINWAAQPNAIGYRIRYQQVGFPGYAQITLTTGGLTSQTISNLLANTTYNIWILTQCVNGFFYQSNTIQCSTSGPLPLVAQDLPLNFSYNDITYVDMRADEVRIAELDALNGDYEVDFSSGTPAIKPLVTGALLGFGIVPNPATNSFEVVLAPSTDVSAEIYLTDMNGSVLMSQTFTTNENQTTVSFDTQDVPAGVYNVTVKTSASTQTQRLIIVD